MAQHYEDATTYEHEQRHQDERDDRQLPVIDPCAGDVEAVNVHGE